MNVNVTLEPDKPRLNQLIKHTFLPPSEGAELGLNKPIEHFPVASVIEKPKCMHIRRYKDREDVSVEFSLTRSPPLSPI